MGNFLSRCHPFELYSYINYYFNVARVIMLFIYSLFFCSHRIVWNGAPNHFECVLYCRDMSLPRTHSNIRTECHAFTNYHRSIKINRVPRQLSIHVFYSWIRCAHGRRSCCICSIHITLARSKSHANSRFRQDDEEVRREGRQPQSSWTPPPLTFCQLLQ